MCAKDKKNLSWNVATKSISFDSPIRQRTFYAEIYSLTRRLTLESLDAVKSRDGHVITESHQILNRWKEYCAKLYNDPNVSGYYPQSSLTFDEDLLPFRTEVEKALKELKKAKAPGFDDVPAELVDGDVAVDVLHKL